MKVLLVCILLTVAAYPQSVCVYSQHSHMVSDFRAMLIRVEAVSFCGIRVADLEENTTPAEPFNFDEKFGVGVLRSDKIDELTKRDIRKGQTGIITYCGYCKSLLVFRMFEKK